MEKQTTRIATPDYCTQNNGDCETCSLVSYGRDCLNFPILPKNDETGEDAAAEERGAMIV